MKLFELALSDLTLSREEIYVNLGYGGQKPEIEFVEMIDQILEQVGGFCVPRAGYLIAEGSIIDKNHIEINSVRIKTGTTINKYLAGSTHFALFVVTAGAEYDHYTEEFRTNGDVVSEYLAYSVGSEIAEATVRFITERIEEEAHNLGLRVTNSYSPGYCSWHVREQENLFKLFPETPCGVTLNESNLMHPVKSVSGLIGLGKDIALTPHACEICGMTSCFKRKI
ncbi:MAG: 5-methyltetrahydrofolate--homocysteine methyltransferase [Bacteroidia bacterium]|nr:5-methyltetrahydrofolate--homocysteine methyltransferase [Bacteroidia bacterium]